VKNTEKPKRRVWTSGPFIAGVVATIAVFVMAAVTLFIWPICISNGPCQTNWHFLKYSASANEIGDTLAGFAGTLAFVWLVVTVLMQGKELNAQHAEFQHMNSNMKAQQFELLFFELISTHNSIVNSMDVRKNDSKDILYQGRDCFGYFYTEFHQELEPERFYPDGATKEVVIEHFEKAMRPFMPDLGHYFRFLFNALRTIDSQGDFIKDRHRKLFRALISDDELLILFYNCQTERGKNFQEFIGKFDLFDNLPEDKIKFSGLFPNPKSIGKA
jgi:hypothetical protein